MNPGEHQHTEIGGPKTSMLATDDCPLCGSKISRTEFLRIQEKIREDEAQKYEQERAALAAKERALNEQHEIEKARLLAEASAQKTTEMQAALSAQEADLRGTAAAETLVALRQQEQELRKEHEKVAAERQKELELVAGQLQLMESEKLQQRTLRQEEQKVASAAIEQLRSQKEEAETKLKQAEATNAEVRFAVETERNTFYAGVLKQQKEELQAEQERIAAENRTEREAENDAAAAAIQALRVEKVEAECKLKQAEAANAEVRAAVEVEVTTRYQGLVNRQQEELARKTDEQAALTNRLQELELEKESVVTTLKSDYEKRIADEQAGKQSALQQLRETLDRERNLALIENTQEHTRERERWQKKIAELERQLQHKTATDLGDMTQLQVLDSLRNAFPGDQITPIPKGAQGADIRVEVVNNGTVCGKVIVDAKNHKAWRNDFVRKLREDQLAEEAVYAVLATTEFPSGEKDFCIADEIVVTSPARVVAIVGILREAVIQMHCLRLSSTERDQKTAKMYEFIMSEKFRQQFGKVEQVATKLLELEVEETQAHRRVWAKRGAFLNSIKDAHGAIGTEIAVIMQG